MPVIGPPIPAPPFNPFGGNVPGPGNLSSWNLHPGGLYTSPWGSVGQAGGGGSVGNLWNPGGNSANTNFLGGAGGAMGAHGFSAGLKKPWQSEYESRGADRAMGRKNEWDLTSMGDGSEGGGSSGYDPGFMRASSSSGLFFGGKPKPMNPFLYF